MNQKEDKNKRQIQIEHRAFVKNSFYSLINSYSDYIFSIMTVFIIARLISQEIWSYLIIANSYIALFTLALAFLPPSLGLSTVYYISKFKALKQNTKLRSFTRNSLILRVIFVIPIFFLSILIFYVFLDFFSLNLKEYSYLFFILVPLILSNGLNPILNDIARSINMFKIVFYLHLIKNILYIGGLFYLFFYIALINVSYIAIIIIISSLIPFIINCFIIFLKFQFKIKKSEEEGESFKECVKKIFKYGSYLSTIDAFSTFSSEIRTQMVSIYEVPGMVTGYHIATRYNSVSGATISPLKRPLSISFTRLYSKEQFNQIQKQYNTIFNYSLLFFLLATGFLFFMADLFLFLIYGETYLIYSLLVKISLISIIFNIQDSFLGSFLIASNKVKILSVIVLVFGPLQLVFFALGLIFFGIIGSVVFSLIANAITLMSYTIILNKFNIKLKIKKTILIFSIFFISLFTALILESLMLKGIYLSILKTLNLLIFQYFNPLTLGVFLMLFIILNIVFKVMTISDVEMLESLFTKDIFSHKIIRKVLSLSKKLFRA